MKISEGYFYNFNNSINVVESEDNGLFYVRNIKSKKSQLYNEFNLTIQHEFKDSTKKIDAKTFSKIANYIKENGDYVGVINIDSECWKLNKSATYFESKVVNRGRTSIIPGLAINGKFLVKIKENGVEKVLVQ